MHCRLRKKDAVKIPDEHNGRQIKHLRPETNYSGVEIPPESQSNLREKRDMIAWAVFSHQPRARRVRLCFPTEHFSLEIHGLTVFLLHKTRLSADSVALKSWNVLSGGAPIPCISFSGVFLNFPGGIPPSLLFSTCCQWNASGQTNIRTNRQTHRQRGQISNDKLHAERHS